MHSAMGVRLGDNQGQYIPALIPKVVVYNHQARAHLIVANDL